jgi:hypothetical protein
MRTPGGRKALTFIAVIGILILAGAWVWDTYLRPRHPVGPTVRIATWNLRHFADRESTDLRAIADIITGSSFDIVAIQEVKQQGEQVDRLLNVLGTPWRSTRLSPMAGNFERFTFIYNGDHVQEMSPPQFIATSETTVFDRTPYQASFRAGQFDFTLVSVHLSYSDTERRRREAETLARYANDLAKTSTEKDVIVLGDFNEQGRGNLHFFETNKWEILNIESSNLSSTEAYDTLLINPKHTFEWSGKAGVIKFDETHFRNRDKRAATEISDHRPAYADFVTNLPDDD